MAWNEKFAISIAVALLLYGQAKRKTDIMRIHVALHWLIVNGVYDGNGHGFETPSIVDKQTTHRHNVKVEKKNLL